MLVFRVEACDQKVYFFCVLGLGRVRGGWICYVICVSKVGYILVDDSGGCCGK